VNPPAEKRLYRCAQCGALCHHPIWDALDIPPTEDKCPGCGKWAKFTLAAEPEREKAA
jgi:DNA-directed RNA polymerase subunit RPC12/RpoP